MAFGPAATKPRPGSVISPFCEPVTATSTPQPSISNGMVPREAMVSSRNSAAVAGGVDRLADGGDVVCRARRGVDLDHQNRLRSEEHTSELQSLMRISYADFCLKKKTNHIQ